MTRKSVPDAEWHSMTNDVFHEIRLLVNRYEGHGNIDFTLMIRLLAVASCNAIAVDHPNAHERGMSKADVVRMQAQRHLEFLQAFNETGVQITNKIIAEMVEAPSTETLQ